MERTLSIQVLGAVGSGKTKLLALITTLLRKEGVLIVGTPSETVCAEHIQVRFDFEAHDAIDEKEVKGFTKLIVGYDDESVMTIQLRNKRLLVDGNAFSVLARDRNSCAVYEVGVRNVTSVSAV